MYIFFNSNPERKYTGDCVVRAISKVENLSWDETLLWLTTYSLSLHEMPVDNDVWKAYLLNHGYSMYLLPTNCPVCYTLKEFCKDYNRGKYIACTGSHVIAVIDGNYYDTWDSGDEIIAYYFRKDE